MNIIAYHCLFQAEYDIRVQLKLVVIFCWVSTPQNCRTRLVRGYPQVEHKARDPVAAGRFFIYDLMEDFVHVV